MTTTHIEKPTAECGMQVHELFALPVAFGLETANRALLMGRTKGFDLAKRGEYPVPVHRDGRTYRVNRADLLRALGIDPNNGGAGPSRPTPPVEYAPLATSANQ